MNATEQLAIEAAIILVRRAVVELQKVETKEMYHLRGRLDNELIALGEISDRG